VSRRILAAAVGLLAVLLGAGCTASDDDPAADDASSPRDTASTSGGSGPSAPPPPAGASEARTLATLPEGAATGSVVLSLSGLGELRAPFDGECSRDGDTTRIDGSADTAQILLEVAPDGVRLELEDVGLSMTSDLATGRYDVTGDHLSLAAELVSADRSAGRAELEIDCDV
jgi:hypothetical protein